jgi:hypothetical protein
MGACTFSKIGTGKSAREAFEAAVREAQYESGHGGYSGTIAEKHHFVMMSKDALSLDAAKALGKRAIDEGDGRIDDKWGPAGCVPLVDGRFYFFGWASS